MPISLPKKPGTYGLLLRLPRRVVLPIGALGRFSFERGWYIYVGSAMGPGGLQARLGRHLSGTGRRRWHIDYLRAAAQPIGAWFVQDRTSCEHRWALDLSAAAGFRMPAPGFGASDCRCPSHLYGFPRKAAVRHLERLMTACRGTASPLCYRPIPS